MDWFLYDNGLRQERVKLFHTIWQVEYRKWPVFSVLIILKVSITKIFEEFNIFKGGVTC